MKLIIDAENSNFGRVCSYAAKQALEGNEIVIINSEKVLITGNKQNVIEKYKNLRAKGGFSQKGPKASKITHKLLKRGIRGMLPNHRWGVGKDAFSRIRCYDGTPKEFENQKTIKIKTNYSNKSIQLKELSNRL